MRYFILLYILISFAPVLFAQVKKVTFEAINSAQGLSQQTVNCILQDSEGFMWFGTRDGLNRYDGYRIIVYESDPIKEGSLSSSHITTLHEDKQHILWIGTANGGLNKFDRHSKTFTSYIHQPDNPSSISGNAVFCMLEDKHGIFWLGTSAGLNRFDSRTGTFTLYQHSSNNPATNWQYNMIHAIIENDDGSLWVGTSKGISLFNKKDGTFNRYPARIDSLKDNLYRVLYKDKEGMIWAGTSKEGLKKFNPHTGHFTTFNYDSLYTNGLADSHIIALLEDKNENLWVGTQFGGLHAFNRQTETFTSYQAHTTSAGTSANHTIMCLYKDSSDILWIGTFSAGVLKLDHKTGRFRWFQAYANDGQGLRDNFIHALYEDKTSHLWIGNRLGLDKLDRNTGTITHIIYDPAHPNLIENQTAHAICESRNGDIWVGLDGSGIKKLNPSTGTITSYWYDPSNPTSISSNQVKGLYEDRNGILWIAARFGLNRFDPVTNTFSSYLPDTIQEEGIKKNNTISCLYEDRNGILWVGTEQYGLNRFDKQTGRFTKYLYMPEKILNQHVNTIYEDNAGNLWVSLAVGGLYQFDRSSGTFHPQGKLPNIVVQAILEDKQGNLWLSTRKNGIFQYTPATKTYRNYSMDDGLLTNAFNKGNFKNDTGEIFFSTNSGFMVFHPDSIQANTYIPRIALTGFTILHTPVARIPSHITLTYQQNIFDFEFASLNYTVPQKNQYAFKLENFHKDWVYTGNGRTASFTNLDPGEYIFKVKASNNDGVWNEEGISVPITILHPPWRTWWAYTLYALFAAGLIYSSYRYLLSRERLKSDLKIKEMEARKLQEMDQIKTHFFTNISHEFRTPLTLILGPVQDMLSQTLTKDELIKNHKVIYSNAKRLLELINQLLDISKLEAGSMPLHLQKADLVKTLKTIVYSFNSLAESRHVTLTFETDQPELPALFDSDKLEKIMFNLLSNAFKFTDPSGKIVVHVSRSEASANDSHVASGNKLKAEPYQEYVAISIRDSGAGIAPEQLSKIFDRFYQVDASSTRKQGGTGIGLALVKELVELHKGTITVSSEVGKGTTFTIVLPTGIESIQNVWLSENLITDTLHDEDYLDKQAEKLCTLFLPDSSKAGNESSEMADINSQLPILLIIEDNPEVASYIKKAFAGSYTILEAGDGRKGAQLATRHIPDLVISDLMMPYMDGMEVCRLLKTDERTSHIPVILLTAKAELEAKIEGLETGADDYLTKPFSRKELQVRVKNLIDQRTLLRERFSKELSLEPKAIAVTSADEKFLKNAFELIEANMADVAFDVEKLSREIGMSRTNLHRKLKALIDQSPSDLIRNFRLKRAAQLLQQQHGNVSEIAFGVGFNSLSYFTKCFHEHFKQTPSEYIRQHMSSNPAER